MKKHHLIVIALLILTFIGCKNETKEINSNHSKLDEFQTKNEEKRSCLSGIYKIVR